MRSDPSTTRASVAWAAEDSRPAPLAVPPAPPLAPPLLPLPASPPAAAAPASPAAAPPSCTLGYTARPTTPLWCSRVPWSSAGCSTRSEAVAAVAAVGAVESVLVAGLLAASACSAWGAEPAVLVAAVSLGLESSPELAGLALASSGLDVGARAVEEGMGAARARRRPPVAAVAVAAALLAPPAASVPPPLLVSLLLSAAVTAVSPVEEAAEAGAELSRWGAGVLMLLLIAVVVVVVVVLPLGVWLRARRSCWKAPSGGVGEARDGIHVSAAGQQQVCGVLVLWHTHTHKGGSRVTGRHRPRRTRHTLLEVHAPPANDRSPHLPYPTHVRGRCASACRRPPAERRGQEAIAASSMAAVCCCCCCCCCCPRRCRQHLAVAGRRL